MRLPTLAEIQKEKLAEIQKEKEVENNTTDQSTKPPYIFKPYNKNNESSVISVPKISIT